MHEIMNVPEHRPHSFTARDVVAIGFRHQRLLVLCFVGVVLGVGLSALVLPTKYRAETKLLVKRERVDPVVSPDQNAPMMFHDTVSEEEINSEVELIQSADVLQKVVVTNGLDKKKFLSGLLHPWQTPANRIDKAVSDLRGDLQLEVIKKTNVISIAYESHDPRLAQQVLATLDDAYVQKHLDVHHPTGQFQFFDQQADQYKKDMLAAEAQLKGFADKQGGVAPTVMRDMTLQKLADFNSTLESTRNSIAETEKRIVAVEDHARPADHADEEVGQSAGAGEPEGFAANSGTETHRTAHQIPAHLSAGAGSRQGTSGHAGGAGERREHSGEGRNHRPEFHV